MATSRCSRIMAMLLVNLFLLLLTVDQQSLLQHSPSIFSRSVNRTSPTTRNDYDAVVVPKRSFAAVPLIRPPSNHSPIYEYCSINDANNSSSSDDCWIPEPIDGAWIDQGPNYTTITKACCAIDVEAIPNDPAYCGTSDWLPFRETYTGREDGFYEGVSGHSCSCRDFHEQYVWKSDLLDEFDATETCRLIGNRTVLLLGDSTAGIASTTLMNALIPGGCQTQIRRQLTDTLVDRNFGVRNLGGYWTGYVERFQPDIVIMSAGAHLLSEEGFVEMFEEVLAKILEYRSTRPNLHLIWATQQPGGCTRDIILDTLPDETALTHPLYPSLPWQHSKFYGRDLYAISRIRQHNLPVFDLRMLYSRTDAKVASKTGGEDCMHLCSPGALEVVLPMFQNLLQHDLKTPE